VENTSRTISAAQFKATCLQLMESVREQHCEVIITKRGRPIAKLVPFDEAPPSLFGFMAGTGAVAGDIVSPSDDAWSAETD
jgi:prevent-host-death family protein